MSEIADLPGNTFVSSQAQFGQGGPRFWVKGVEVDRKTWERATWWPGNPIYDALLKERGACSNCRCTDCHCCYGCGRPDSDFFGVHGVYNDGSPGNCFDFDQLIVTERD